MRAQTGRRRSADGDRPPPARPRTGPPLRSRQPGRIQLVVATPDREELRWAGLRGGWPS
jgi:hypothetical protein